MKIAIVGSRSFNDYNLLKWTLKDLNPSLIVSGGAQGADTLAERYAKEIGVEIFIFRPDWGKYGRAAGPIRNKQIVEASDMVFAFWDGESRGTLSTINFARTLGVPVHVIRYLEKQ